MGWFTRNTESNSMSYWGNDEQQSSTSDVERAEAYLRNQCEDENHISALIRHYHVSETNQHIERFSGARITDQQAAQIVQKLRDEFGIGAIKDYNMPGYVCAEDYPEDQEDQRRYNAERVARDTDIEREQHGGFFGRPFGR